MSFKFIAVEHPSVKKTVKIAQGGKGQGKNLDLNWRGLSRDQAGAALEVLECAGAVYMQDVDGVPVPLRHSEAVENWVTLRTNEGDVQVPKLHAGVYERGVRERIATRQQALQLFISGTGDFDVPGVTDEVLNALPDEPLLESWNLLGEHDDDEVLDHTDPAIYDMVFSRNEFFFPILESLVEALGEMANGESKAKNSKTSVNSSSARSLSRLRA